MGQQVSVQMKDGFEGKQRKPLLLPTTIYQIVVQFLSLKEILILGSTCRLYYQYQQQCQSPFMEHYYRTFLSDQITMTIELSYPSPEYRDKLRKQVFTKTEVNWLQKYRNLHFLKNQSKIPFVFCEFTCPKPVLRRETIGIYIESDLQAMLAQRLELEQKGFEKLFQAQIISEKFMRYLKDNKQHIILVTVQQLQAVPEEKAHFLSVRWLLDEAASFGSQQELQPHVQCEFLQVMIGFEAAIRCYLEGLSAYLQAFAQQDPKNAADVLFEYVNYWQAYSNSLLELQTLVMPYEEIVNEVYAQLFPEYAQYPKFGVWRCLVCSWIRIILKGQGQFGIILEECYMKLLKHLRQKNLNKQFDLKKSFTEVNDLYITHEIYNNFQNKRQISQYNTFSIETAHPIFEDFTDILAGFFKALQDISLNEVSVHWVGHTDLIYEEIYDTFCKRFLQDTSLYYDQSKGIFDTDITQFINFLRLDINFLQTFIPEPLLYEVHNLQRDHLYSQISFVLEDPIGLFLENNEELIYKIYHSQSKQRMSTTSSNNDHLDTQGDNIMNETQKMFQFMMENPNADVEELYLKDKMSQEPDQLLEIIRVALSYFQKDIDRIANEEFCTPPSIELARAFSQRQRQVEKVDFPDELLKQLHSYLLGNHIVSRMLDSFKLYGYDYEKVKIKHSQRNQEIRLLNDDRELPLALPEFLQDFYFVTRPVTLQILELNRIDDPQAEEEPEVPSLSKNSSKYQKEPKEEYISESEDEPAAK